LVCIPCGKTLSKLNGHAADKPGRALPQIPHVTGILVACLALVATTLGGLVAVRVRDRLHLLLGFSAGAVLGVVFFDVFPELLERAADAHVPIRTVMGYLVGGFLVFLLLEMGTSLHAGREHEHHHGHEHNPEMGLVAAAGLSVHSFLDGLAIGIGFRSSTALGIAIGLAVLTHDFSDGLNTVTVVLAHGNPLKAALRWLGVDAVTPVLGATVAVFAPSSFDRALPYLLAVFAGFFLYIGSSDLLPEAREHKSPWVAVATMGGLATLFAVTSAL
jgi:ZIP family zinc transporter